MNKKVIIPALAGVVTGVIVTILIIVASGQSMMLKEKQVPHNFEEAVELIETTVRLKGWTIPAVHNMQATLANFGHDVEKMKIFEICHPDLAYPDTHTITFVEDNAASIPIKADEPPEEKNNDPDGFFDKFVKFLYSLPCLQAGSKSVAWQAVYSLPINIAPPVPAVFRY